MNPHEQDEEQPRYSLQEVEPGWHGIVLPGAALCCERLQCAYLSNPDGSFVAFLEF
jgi:hypothetical protein